MYVLVFACVPNPCVHTMEKNLSFDVSIRQTMNGMIVPNQRSKLKPD